MIPQLQETEANESASQNNIHDAHNQPEKERAGQTHENEPKYPPDSTDSGRTHKKEINIVNDLRIENKGDVHNQTASIKVQLFTTGVKEELLAFDYFKRRKARKFQFPNSKSGIIKQLKEYNFIIINCDSSDVCAEALDHILYQETISHCAKPICCTLEDQNSLKLRSVIDSFQESEHASKEDPQTLIIFDTRDSAELIDQFIRFVYNANSWAALTDLLKSRKISVIYCCSCQVLYSKTLEEGIPLYNIKFWDTVLYQHYQNAEVSSQLGSRIYNLIRKTGWLIDCTELEKINAISKLVGEGELEPEIKNRENGINDEEDRRLLLDMLSDPLKNALLFVVAFFDLSVIDFQNIVNTILAHNDISNNQNGAITDNFLNKWQYQPDILLEECGLTISVSNGIKHPTVSFKPPIRKNVCRDLITTTYKIQLDKIFNRIWTHYLTSDNVLSQSYLNGIVEMCFINAKNDSGNYVATVCSSIVDAMLRSSESKIVINSLFFRLLCIIRKCEEPNSEKDTLEQFYDNMVSSDIKRVILSAIFTDVCSPEYPHNIYRLKKLLESIGKEEVEPMLDTMHYIFLNHVESIFEVLAVIQTWQKEDKSINQAFSYATCSFLKILYKNWEDGTTKSSSVEYHLLRHLTANNPLQNMKKLGQFVFSKKNWQAFTYTYRPNTVLASQNEKLVQKEALDGLLLRYGLILVQMKTVCKFIFNLNSDQHLLQKNIMLEMIQIIGQNYGSHAAKLSISKAIAFYNEAILSCNKSSAQEKELKRRLIVKRNVGREIQKFLNEISI